MLQEVNIRVWGVRVRDFEVIDAFPFGIQFSWDKDGEQTTTVLFERNGPIPSAKMLTFFRCGALPLLCNSAYECTQGRCKWSTYELLTI